jgi:hypothetical protein
MKRSPIEAGCSRRGQYLCDTGHYDQVKALALAPSELLSTFVNNAGIVLKLEQTHRKISGCARDNFSASLLLPKDS